MSDELLEFVKSIHASQERMEGKVDSFMQQHSADDVKEHSAIHKRINKLWAFLFLGGSGGVAGAKMGVFEKLIGGGQ
jgi:hypothetical protein